MKLSTIALLITNVSAATLSVWPSQDFQGQPSEYSANGCFALSDTHLSYKWTVEPNETCCLSLRISDDAEVTHTCGNDASDPDIPFNQGAIICQQN